VLDAFRDPQDQQRKLKEQARNQNACEERHDTCDEID
jgi:hypothetical protein